MHELSVLLVELGIAVRKSANRMRLFWVNDHCTDITMCYNLPNNYNEMHEMNAIGKLIFRKLNDEEGYQGSR